MKTEKKQVWREHGSPKEEEGKMKVFLKTKAGVVLVGFSVLTMWMLLAAQPVQAHTTALPTPTCSGLPADDFFTAPSTIGTAGTASPDLDTARGTGTTARERLHYAKIMIPALAAGELRVHSTETPTDAVLCRGTSTRATSRTDYRAHNSATSAATAATNAADRAALPGASVSSARSALRSAASALTTVANALTGQDATDATDAAGTARTFADDTTNTDTSTFETPLDNAATALTNAANDLHAGFQIRATVRPGDEEYVLVVAVTDAATVDPALAVQFNGAIESTALGHQDSFSAGQVRSRTIVITAPGLLTLEEKGSTDTMGTFDGDMIPSGGSDGNFTMVKPVQTNTTGVTLNVEGLTPTTAGAYTLNMDFKVAMPAAALTGATGVTAATFTGWGDTAIAADDTTLQIDGSVIGGGASVDEDYFLFMPDAAAGFLTIAATNAVSASSHSNTVGTLYGPDGEIAVDDDSGEGKHFKFRVPVDNMDYLLKVTGTTGQYALSFTPEAATAQGTSESRPEATVACANDNTDDDNNVVNEICARGTRLQQERDRFLLDVVESGALYVHSTGDIDTVGTLYGPDGREIATDDNGGQGTNFRIAANVSPGLHIVEVRGQNAMTEGAYGLVTNFITGAEPIDPTDPTDPVDPVDPGQPGVTTDSTGRLEDPPNGGTRSGIGLIRGWVCGATRVEVRIAGPSGPTSRNYTIPVLYGSDRGDVEREDVCDRRGDNFGFAAQFNYSELPAGTYTAQAFADGEQIGQADNGQTNTFEVIRLSDTDSFLEELGREVTVENFPFRGDTTVLEWDEASQNFQIKDKTP